MDLPYDKEIVEEILELIVDTVCTTKETVRISGDDKPAEVVRSRFLKLDSEHYPLRRELHEGEHHKNQKHPSISAGDAV